MSLNRPPKNLSQVITSTTSFFKQLIYRSDCSPDFHAWWLKWRVIKRRYYSSSRWHIGDLMVGNIPFYDFTVILSRSRLQLSATTSLLLSVIPPAVNVKLFKLLLWRIFNSQWLSQHENPPFSTHHRINVP